MASTRESSPVNESGSTTSPQLTPNSKVKAMLAAFEKDSDDESISGSARARLVSSFTRITSSNAEPIMNEREMDDAAAREGSETASEGEDDEEEEIVRPRGRLAAAMLARDNGFEGETASAGDDARERVKKMLISTSKTLEPTSNAEDAGSGESDVPVVSRKRKIGVSRHCTPQSSPERAPASPGLFVSPNALKSAALPGDVSDSDELPENPTKNDRFNALVEKKRQEILVREKEAAEKKARKTAERRRHAEMLEEDDDMDGSDDKAGRRLTQQVRPTRKASKRALEEMHRETQRLSRNQQLAHNAITKKKFTKADFMARFKFRTGSEDSAEPIARPASSSSAPNSDFEAKDTPPTSPASHADESGKLISAPTLPSTLEQEDDEELPIFEEPLTQVPSFPTRIDKGKGKAIEEVASESEKPKGPIFKQRPIRIRPPKIADRKASPLDDSDSDLEIVSAKTPMLKKKMDSIFDRVPAKQAKESHSLQALRMLAHLTSPGKQNFGKNKKPSMTTSELQMSLQQRARQQATREREERLQALRDKGVIVQTTEERQKEMAEVEDLISKARREGEEIMKREKAAAKTERKDRGEVDPLGDSSDDEDWEENKENIPEEHFVSGSDEGEEESGSEDVDASGEEEDEDEMELEHDEAAESVANAMFDNEAAESNEDDDETGLEANLSIDEDIADDGDVDEDELPVKQKSRRARNKNVISDDEDTVSNDDQRSPSVPKLVSPAQANMASPMAPNSVLRSATKTFIPGLTVTGPVGLGLTQIFAGTMDDSQFAGSPSDQDSQSQQKEPEQHSMSFLRRLAAPELPPFVPTIEEDTQELITNSQSQISHITESQPVDSETQGVELNFSQSQTHGFDSLVEGSQISHFPDATQDVGFQHMTPIKGRFVDAPPSTVNTLVMDPTALPETMEKTPIVKKKGKLRRRAPAVVLSDDEDDVTEPVDIGEEDFEINENFFDVMRKASKKKKVVVEDFDKKNSKAKDMVNEQADESEDEYAGLGGASDDESGGEADEYIKAMIDDEGGKEIDESKLAAFFADRERANDEKQVEKLYKDITNGMLRRKRGADYDLSDSDDGGEARRHMKRKEFAKMRKALLADERIGKIAENPKRQAFLRAIEDRGSEDEIGFLDDFPEQEEGDSQSQSQADGFQQVVPNSQPTDMGPPKRKRSADTQESDARLPPHLRRTKPAKKPTNLSEIRESLSSLIEEPNAMIAVPDSGSESEDELEIEGEDDLGPRKEKDKENRDPFTLRRSRHAVIDRISLKRATSNAMSNNTRLAFAASSMIPGFKVPALLRRATTNSSLASSTSSSVSGGMSATERMAGTSGSDGVKRGGGKNSGVNYFARESERRAAVVKTEKRREQKRFKGAELRRKVVGGLFGGGQFE